jgi:hypothetical protein
MCENMVIWCLGSISIALRVVSEALCLIYDEHYTKSGNCSVSDKEKVRGAMYPHLISKENGDACYVGASPFYLTAKKRI